MGHMVHGVFGVNLTVMNRLNLKLQHIGHLVGGNQLGSKGEEGGEIFNNGEVAGVSDDIVIAFQNGLLGHVQHGGVAYNSTLPVFL